MLVLKTNCGVRRYCSRCKAPMKVTKDSDGVFAAHCSESANKPGPHDSVLQSSNHRALQQYAIELFAPKRHTENK